MSLVCAACTPEAISVLAAPNSAEGANDSPLRVNVDATSVHLPLRAAGERVVFVDLDDAVRRAVDVDLAPSRELLRRRGGHPLDLLVELVAARAEQTDGRLVVYLTARATLRERAGAYVGQTHARAATAGPSAPEHGVAVVRQAADALGAKVADFVAASLPP
ncbi:MAG TPA: hypothetical protein VMI54_14275 [Polyangiaceae bacterium]|nr:hypothetical protein [Polyangiaceae bacterium]